MAYNLNFLKQLRTLNSVNIPAFKMADILFQPMSNA